MKTEKLATTLPGSLTTEVILLAQIRNLEEIIVLQQTALVDITCKFNALCKKAVAVEVSDFRELQ